MTKASEESPRAQRLRVAECGDGPIWFTGLGDTHWGARGCWKPGVIAAIEEIKRRKAWWVGMGNYTNCGWSMLRKEGALEDEMLVDDQLEQYVELLRPIADRCVGLVGGKCHEGWLEAQSGFRLVKHMCYDLGVDWLGLNARFVLRVGQQRYRVHAWHGSGSPATLMGKFNPALRMKEKSDSDIYMMAHVHQALYYPTYFTEARGGLERQMKRIFLVTGHFQYKSDYAEARNLPLGKMGLMWLRLAGERWSVQGGDYEN